MKHSNVIERSTQPAIPGIRAGVVRQVINIFMLGGILAITAKLVGQQPNVLPENPLKGRIVFEQKGCVNCHGGSNNVGPDLNDTEYYGSSLELASVMWNHLPKMMLQINELGLPFPRFTSSEFSDLLAYLYYLRYLGKPGDLSAGKTLFENKGCKKCHSVSGIGGSNGPELDSLGKYISPLYLAQALWNHGPEMDDEMARMGIKRPRFEKGEIVNLQAYIRAASRGTGKSRVYQSPGNPQRGTTIFKEKKCPECHAINGIGEDIGPDLGKMKWNYSVHDIAGNLWNHSSEMNKYMKEQNLQWPRLNSSEMADLIAFLYFLGFNDQPGNPKTGLTIFRNKGCVKCHEITGENQVARIQKSTDLRSGVTMAQIMWNHAPVMEKKATEKVFSWPNLTGEDMINIYAFLLTVYAK